MSVEIEPLELNFRRPFTYEVSQTLTLKNPSTTPVAFKVKTTAPKQYCVRPNAGRIEPGQDFDVSVLLQAMKQEPPADAKCRDKFLVQSASITGDKEFASIASVFDSTEKSQITERKIRVNWLAATSDDGAAPAVVATPAKQTGAAAADTPNASQRFTSPTAGNDSPPTSSPPPYDGLKGSEHEEKSAAEPVKQAAASVANSASATANLAATKVKEATATDSAVRQRVKSGADEVKHAAQQVNQAVPEKVQGVPVRIVALLVFLAFLVGYFFF